MPCLRDVTTTRFMKLEWHAGIQTRRNTRLHAISRASMHLCHGGLR
jgi:hypothetical protein